MTIKTEKPLDYSGQVWRGIDDKFPKRIHNATTTSDGLMSAEDKAKLDSIDASRRLPPKLNLFKYNLTFFYPNNSINHPAANLLYFF